MHKRRFFLNFWLPSNKLRKKCCHKCYQLRAINAKVKLIADSREKKYEIDASVFFIFSPLGNAIFNFDESLAHT